jgi:anionic cell wall polymer biosynthesis LytR-Cps2A-Psr (LCP) family protein
MNEQVTSGAKYPDCDHCESDYPIIQKGASFSSLNKFDDVLAILGDNVKTDLSFDQMVDIQANYKSACHSLEQLQVKGSGEKINRFYYFIVPEEERVKLSNTLKEHLELK